MKLNNDLLHMPESYWKGFTRAGLKEIAEVLFGARYSDLDIKNSMLKRTWNSYKTERDEKIGLSE